MMETILDRHNRLSELIDHQRRIYSDHIVEEKLAAVIGESPYSSLAQRDVVGIFHHSRAILFDTHVAVVSGHHTETYVQFESIAQYPQLVSIISGDMAQWVLGLSEHHRIDGLLVPASDARLLAEGMLRAFNNRLPMRIVEAPFNSETGKISTEVSEQAIGKGEKFVVLNDVTSRGNCVSKLGKIVTAHGAHVVGMMVFARRDSGQFPLMDELTAKYPFYYSTRLNMPQWETSVCPLCHRGETVFSWRDMPTLASGAPLLSNTS